MHEKRGWFSGNGKHNRQFFIHNERMALFFMVLKWSDNFRRQNKDW